MTDLETLRRALPSGDPLWSPERLAAVDRLGLAAREARDDVEPVVADLLDHLKEVTGADTVLVTALLGDALAVVAARGLGGWIAEAGGLPAEWAMCSTTARQAAAYAVADLACDPDWAETPLVALEGLRSYAGVPLVSREGAVVGTVCAIGDTPGALHDDALEELAVCAGEVLARLEGRVAAG